MAVFVSQEMCHTERRGKLQVSPLLAWIVTIVLNSSSIIASSSRRARGSIDHYFPIRLETLGLQRRFNRRPVTASHRSNAHDLSASISNIKVFVFHLRKNIPCAFCFFFPLIFHTPHSHSEFLFPARSLPVLHQCVIIKKAFPTVPQCDECTGIMKYHEAQVPHIVLVCFVIPTVDFL